MNEPVTQPIRARTAAVVVAILFLLGLAGLSIWNTVRLREHQRLVTHTHAVLTKADAVATSLIDAESQARGFYITGGAQYRELYDAAVAGIPTRLDELSALVGDNSRQQANLVQFREIIGARLAVLRDAVTARAALPEGTAPAAPVGGEGFRLGQAVRAHVELMKADESRLLAEREASANTAFWTALTTEVGVTVFGIAMVVGLYTLERRRLREIAAAAALISAERERLGVTLSSIGDAVIATDTDANVVLLNPVAERLTGWLSDDAAGRPLATVFNIINEDTRAPVPNPSLRALREGVVVGLANHTILVSRDGTEHPVDDSAAPIRNAQNEVIGSVLVFRDITARRQTEEAARLAHARRLAMIDSALDCIVTMDGKGHILEFNPACERAFGVGRAMALGHSMRDLIIAPPARAAFDAATRDLAENRNPAGRLEFMALRADGTEFPVEMSIAGLPNDGEPLIAAYLRDITDRKEGERRQAGALEAEQVRSAQLRKVAAASVILNSSSSEAELARIVETEASGILETEVDLVLADEPPATTGIVAPVRGPGKRPFGYLTATPREGQSLGGDDMAILEQLANMTAIAIENARLYERLRENDRYKDEFLAILAHELRNPLAPIRTGLSLLAISNGDQKVFEQARAMIERQVAQMVRLIDDLMDVARVSRGKMELRRQRITLSEVLNSALESSRAIVESAGHELRVTFPPEPIPLDADLTRLAQVFFNLVSNAAKYTERGGQISISAERDGRWVFVRVRDTGKGIPREMLARVFEMFTQVDPTLEHSRGGLGIGLTIVKKLVELHNGSVEVLSEGQGHGTEFVVKLPVAQEEEEVASTDGHPSRTSAPVKPRRVLVVDDNQDSVDSLALMLRLLGHDVQVAYDGVQAVDMTAAFKPEFVLLDIGLPRLNGYQAAERIRELPGGGEWVLVAVTGWGQDEDRRRSQEAGFDRHLVKPVEPSAIAELIGDGSVCHR